MNPSDMKPIRDRDGIIKLWSTIYDKNLLRAMTDDELYKLMFQRIYLGRRRDDGDRENDKSGYQRD